MFGQLTRICRLPIGQTKYSYRLRQNWQLGRVICWFSEKKPIDKQASPIEPPTEPQQPTQPLKEEFEESELELIKKADESDKSNERARLLNIFMERGSDSSFMKDLVVARKAFRNTQNTSQLRDAILFEEILNNQLVIPIYDTQGRFYRSELRKLLMYLTVIGLSWFCYYMAIRDPKFEIEMTRTTKGHAIRAVHIFCSAVLFFYAIRTYRRKMKLHVEKIAYNTADEYFDFTRRKFWGTTYPEKVHRHELVYTENEHLWRMGVNYFHVQSKRLYEIGVSEAWKRQDLFSHLISQRIRRSMQTAAPPKSS